MATTSNAAMRKKTPFYVSIFMIHDTSSPGACEIIRTSPEHDDGSLFLSHGPQTGAWRPPGFAVLAPDIAGYRALRIRPSDAREIADAFTCLVGRPELAPDGRAGMFGFSYSVGPALLAALRDDIRERR